MKISFLAFGKFDQCFEVYAVISQATEIANLVQDQLFSSKRAGVRNNNEQVFSGKKRGQSCYIICKYIRGGANFCWKKPGFMQ